MGSTYQVMRPHQLQNMGLSSKQLKHMALLTPTILFSAALSLQQASWQRQHT